MNKTHSPQRHDDPNDPLAAPLKRVEDAAADAFEKAGAFRDGYLAHRSWKTLDRRGKDLRAALEKFHRERRQLEEIALANAPTGDSMRER